MWVHSKSHSLMAFVGFLSRQGCLATCPGWIVWVGLRLRKFKENRTKFTHQGRFFILKCHFVILKSHTAAFLLAFSALGWIVATSAGGWLFPRILPRWLPRPSVVPRRRQGGGLSTVVDKCQRTRWHLWANLSTNADQLVDKCQQPKRWRVLELVDSFRC